MNDDARERITRRHALQAGVGLTAAGAVDATAAPPLQTRPGIMGESVYDSLGIKPIINAAGTITTFGGSVMPSEVVAAWVDAARHFVDLVELQNKVGDKIAKLLGTEAAYVTTGAAGAILLGTAAAVTRGDRKLIPQLPANPGARNEVLIQKTHHSCYDNQLTDVGVKLIDVETVADVEKAVTEHTALMFFMNISQDTGKIKRDEWCALARKHKVPTLIDAAADVPPVSRIVEYAKMGFDMIAVSGGKAMRGPNDTGLLLGRKDLIAAAKLNANPHGCTIGRMMKVGKEDMIALLAAVERFVRLDPAAELAEYERKISVIEKALKDVPSVAFEHIVPEIANHVPHLQIAWNEKQVKIKPEAVAWALSEGEPSIRIGRVSGTGDKGILISVLTLQADEEKIVAARVAEILKKAAG
ncbi:MAG: aminotransferase class V-fold PLP-dependent enzyme [Planctomycetes bacterium]|nr:aminotransferase class V-fold PLP-dependent enzyme [Planctomycetota bacterium]